MEKVTLCAVGDVTAFFNNPESGFEFTGPTLREADITFCQNERHYTDRKDAAPAVGSSEITSTRNAEALKLGGFDVISFASNHCMDLGATIMMETVGVLRKLGATVIGVGNNIDEARKPAIFERKGTKIGFLAYASVIRNGYNAGPMRPGCAPMRAYTLYNQIDYQAGTPPQILTFPYKEDLQAIVEDVKKLRSQVDVLAVSMHWGVHLTHAVIATYQPEVAHAIIDAGADIILGHHPHVPKGIEVYKGKPIFYSMGNFMLDIPADELELRLKQSTHVLGLTQLYGWKVDHSWPLYTFPPESRKSMIVRCNIVDKKIQRVAFLPVMINPQAQPKIVPREDKTFDEMFEYMKDLSESQGFKTRYSIEGNEIVVSLA